MKEITYYAFKDKDYQTANRGLLDVNYTPRQSFYTLQRLITKEWTTRLETKTDANGQVKFRGFAGNYTLTIRTENGLVNSTIHVNKQASQVYTIKIGQPSTHVAGMVEAEQAIANATEAVNKAKAEGRTILLDKAESLLQDAQRALAEENYTQAVLSAQEANQAAESSVTWLVVPVAVVFVGVAVAVIVWLRKRAKKND
jgi:cobalamin biosynthesis Mg chelatase CobN